METGIFKTNFLLSVKVKVFPLAYAGIEGGGIISPTHSQIRRWKGLERQHHTPAVLPSKKTAPIVHKAGWFKGTVRKGTNSLASIGIRSPDCTSRSESLYRLLHPGLHINTQNVSRHNRAIRVNKRYGEDS